MLKYLPSHEYARVDGDFAYVGISPYAAKQLGNVVYVDMPEEGDEVEKGEEFGAIESVKAASDLFSPVSGEIVEVNAKLEDDPRAVSEDPLANWIIKVKMSNPAEMDELMDQAAYDAHCAAEQH
ncbi:MAG: glycine cleavage system protein GcvH [Muribaculaceae bacterium]|nr:glycine cleavage system protein GcvH [Muribaculaceae bacterium]